jgi:hypothetical protein
MNIPWPTGPAASATAYAIKAGIITRKELEEAARG